MLLEYELSKRQTIAALKNVQTMIHDSVSQAIWEFNSAQLETILRGLYNNNYVVGVKLEVPQNKYFADMTSREIGLVEDDNGNLIYTDPDNNTTKPVKRTFEYLIPYSFVIHHVDALGRDLTIGKMYLYSSNRIVFAQVEISYLLMIINGIIKTISLWIFFLWAGYYYISKPLVQLKEAIKQLASGKHPELIAKQANPKQKTEINILFDTFNDMTKNLQQTQDKLRYSTNRLNNIFDTMPSALVSINSAYIIQGWNKYMVQITGIETNTAIGKSLHDIFPAFIEYAYLIQDSLRDNKEQQLQHVKIDHSKETESRLYHITVYPIKAISPPEAVIRIDDVTEQAKAEAGMAQVEKLASVGASIAGVAHEINNPLGSIMQSSQNILRRIDPNLESNKQVAINLNLDLHVQYKYLEQREIIVFLENIRQAGERASNIVKNMLKFMRRSTPEMSQQDIVDIINDSLTLCANDINIQEYMDFKDIRINKHFCCNELIIECYPLEIQQVILNIIRNAVQAMDPKQLDKIITITLDKLEAEHKIQLKIQDNGLGMSAEILSHIFQPFFTTKPVGEGTGLGLSVCKNIVVQKHHGDLRAESEVGVGTIFIITLPIQQPRSSQTINQLTNKY